MESAAGSDTSNHCGLIVDWKRKPPYSHLRSRLNHRQIWMCAYADFAIDMANEMLSNTDWDHIVDCSDID